MGISKNAVKAKVREAFVMEHYRKTAEILIPVTISNRHIHLNEEAVNMLFGPGYQLTKRNEVFQPGQYACQETVTLNGPKGALRNVRVLGPLRSEPQVEVSVTDCFTLGIPPVIRLSGDVADTPGLLIEGPCGSLSMETGAIVASRHVHMSPKQAQAFGLKHGDMLELASDGVRPVAFRDMVVRVHENFELEAHLDTDEANAACLHNDMLMRAKPDRR